MGHRVGNTSRADAGTPLEGLTGTIPPPAVSPLYRLGLAAVLALLVLLPVVYLGLIAGVAYLTYWHWSHNWFLLADRSYGRRVSVALYFTPIIVGASMVLFMIKPILARRAKAPARQVVTREQEPLLFAFIARVCRVVQAPVPKEVVLDCQVNAAASFRRGIWSFGSHDLTLTIGLPLVAGLTLRELSGVLAHEFGHFAQGAGMRATFLIRSINGWFARLVFERDEWDRRLDRLGTIDLRLTAMVWLAKAGIWMTRRILQGLMLVGHACSCFMLRQMEFDADRYEIELAGTDGFLSTSRKLPVLNLALMQAIEDARTGWRAKRLPDDLPELVLHRDAMLTDREKTRIVEHTLQEQTGALDTHPSMRDRVEAAHRLKRRGLFLSDAPSSSLFRDFAATSRKATMAYYEDVVGLPVRTDRSMLVPTANLASDGAAARQATDALESYYGGVLSPYRPIDLPVDAADAPELVTAGSDAEPTDQAALRHHHATARAAARAIARTARKANDAFHETMGKQIVVQRARVLIENGATLSAKDWQLEEASAAGVERALAGIEAQHAKLRATLDESDRQTQASLVAAIALVQVASPATPLAAYREELPRLLSAFASVRASLDLLVDIGVYGSILQNLLHNAQEQGSLSEEGSAFLANLAETLEPMLQRVSASCGTVLYPFNTNDGEVTLEQFLFGHDLPTEPVLETLVRATRLMEVLPELYMRLLGRVAQIAQAIDVPSPAA